MPSKYPALLPLALLLAAALSVAAPVRAEDPTAPVERHLFLFDYYGIATWLLEALVDLDPTGVPHMEMYEVTRYPRLLKPTPAQQTAADALVAAAHEAAERHGWYDFDRAVADGYVAMAGDDAHYVHRGMLQDGRVLDVDHPEFLMYYDTDSGKKLAGYMFLVEQPDAEGPQVGGPLTRWHFHIWHDTKCLLYGLLVVGDAAADGTCAEGLPTHRSPEMLHLWLIDHPDGTFATKMQLAAWQVRQLEQGPHAHH